MNPQARNSQLLLETQGLCRSFGGVKAVDDVDFSLPEGEIRAIIGPNGAGKTTFVSLFSGRISASAGTVFFAGENITLLPDYQRVRKGIAYTFQITSVYTNLSVEENVIIAVQNRPGGADHRQNAAVVRAVLQQAGIAELAATPAGELAYGHQRLLEVAMGLALNPRLLILDEPTQGLSDPEIETFCTLVRQINQTTTILLIEHNMPVVMRLADSISVFDQGRILAEGTPEDIRNNDAVQAAYLGA